MFISEPDVVADHRIIEWQYRGREAVANCRVCSLVVRGSLFQSQTVLLGVINAKQRRQPFVVRDVLNARCNDFLGLTEKLFVSPLGFRITQLNGYPVVFP